MKDKRVGRCAFSFAPAVVIITTIILFLLSCDQLLASKIDVMYMTSGPSPSMSVDEHKVSATPQSATMLNGIPTSSWTYGCSPTAAGMMFGYYDRNGYSNMYSGTANGGVAPLTDLGNQSSLIATRKGLDGRTTNGHVDDYWGNGSSLSPDPWQSSGLEHTWEGCTADYMGSNQLKWDYIGYDGVKDYCLDGITAMFSINSSQKLYDYVPGVWSGIPQTALCHGLRLFAESRGYSVMENYTQKIDTLYTGGFSFADYMVEIDLGSPVMVQLTGHTMLGVGYEAASQTMYIHDTWGDYVSSMVWGNSYSGMNHLAMTVLHLNPTPEPTTILYFITSILILSRCKKRHPNYHEFNKNIALES